MVSTESNSTAPRRTAPFIHYVLLMIYRLYRLRPRMARSTDAIPPPEIIKARDIASNDIAYSKPLGAKKVGQCTPITAVSIVQAIRKAPTLVNNPIKTRMPPINSASAAAPIQSQAGRMKGKGAGNEVNLARPGPSKLLKTFCAPCAAKITPRVNRRGSVIHVGEVAISLRNIGTTFQGMLH